MEVITHLRLLNRLTDLWPPSSLYSFPIVTQLISRGLRQSGREKVEVNVVYLDDAVCSSGYPCPSIGDVASLLAMYKVVRADLPGSSTSLVVPSTGSRVTASQPADVDVHGVLLIGQTRTSLSPERCSALTGLPFVGTSECSTCTTKVRRSCRTAPVGYADVAPAQVSQRIKGGAVTCAARPREPRRVTSRQH